MIEKLLIANRGEIACRIIRTAHDMGIATVAVYSDADARALHVRSADEAVHIGPSPAAESYLVGEKIIAAAKQTGAQAIHPGYGFLSENAAFARAVIDAGLIWVGPKPSSIEAMGLKDAAKKLMRAAGVPVTPGYEGEDQSVERLKSEADAIGYPVLIKAVAGGGGKGMRKVDAAADFEAMLESCRREAKASFSNDEVLLEKWITSPRHIEVQVFGDSHGNVVHLFERDCSLQRRHQKVIEEAPAPGMDEATRAEICAAAVRAAKAVDYEGAGTIEFIADASEGLRADRIFFMEMNTRLQVEHPVTEMVTGIDLVREQLRVARGEPLDFAQEDITFTGSAVEARLYAEDPANNFLPVTGTIATLDTSNAPPVRWDSGVESGSVVGINFDPMLAKVIAHGPNRTEASSRLALSLERTHLAGMRTNRDFLVNVLRTPEFQEGDTTTDFIPRVDPPRELVLDDAERDLGFHLATLFTHGGAGHGATGSVAFDFRNERFEISYAVLDDGEWEFGDGTIARIHSRAPDRLDAEVGGVQFRSMVTQVGPELFVQTPSGDLAMTLAPTVADSPSEAAGSSAMEAVALAAYGVHRHRSQRVRTVPSSTPWEIAGRLEQLARSQ